MPGEGRPILQAIRTQVGLSGSLKKTAATKAERGVRLFEFPKTVPANDFFSRLLKERRADLA
jgi:hypothetical protein